MRAERIGKIPENLIIYPQTDIDGVLEYLNKEIIAVNSAIRSHQIEQVGDVLRGAMTAMKSIKTV